MLCVCVSCWRTNLSRKRGKCCDEVLLLSVGVGVSPPPGGAAHLELSTALSTVSSVLLTPITQEPAVSRVGDDSSGDAEPLPTRRK